MVYDTIHYFKEANKDGLLLLMDFEKAFHSVSWDSLYKTLELFNIGNDIKNQMGIRQWRYVPHNLTRSDLYSTGLF